MSIPSYLPSCPRSELPTSMIIQPCSINWKNLVRVVFRKLDGAVPFTGLDEAAQITAITSDTEWQTLIDESDPDNIILTPKVTNAALVAGDAQTDDGEDQSITWTGDVALSIMELTFRGLSSENEALLNDLQGQGLAVMFIMKDGQTLGNTVIGGDGEVDTFFKAELSLFGGRNHETGATPDTNIMTIYFRKEELMGFEFFATEAFGLIIGEETP